MDKYPLKPWALIVVYVGLAMASSLAEMLQTPPPVRNLALYGPGLALLLQYIWSWQAVRFTSIAFKPATKFRKRFELLLKLAAMGAAIIVIGTFLNGGPVKSDAGDVRAAIITIVFGWVVIAVAFAALWNAAAALCMAEDGAETPPSRIVGTFLLFLVLVVGAPFIYRRLEALGESQSLTARAIG